MEMILYILIGLVIGVLAGWLAASARKSPQLQAAATALEKAKAERDSAQRERERREQLADELQNRLEVAQHARVESETRLAEAEKKIAELTQFVGDAKQQLEGTYARLSSQALDTAIEKLLQVVKPHLDGTKGEITSTLDAKKTEIDSLLSPLREMIEKYRAELQQTEQTRAKNQGGLEELVRQLLTANEAAQRETSKLVSALRVPTVRGSWGEATLRTCVELAGMSEFCDFAVQQTFENDEGRKLRPDMVVRLPNHRVIAVDSKAPVDAYLEAVAEVDENRKRDLLGQHAKNLRKHIDQLSRREYQGSVGETLDFTILFLGGEQFLSAALITDPTIFEYSTGKKIYLASPTVLLPLLRAVAAGWKAERAEENAQRALEIGVELYARFVKVFEHIEPVGKSLASAVDKYNAAVKSINTRLVPQVVKLQSHVSAIKEFPQLDQVDSMLETVNFGETIRLPIRDLE